MLLAYSNNMMLFCNLASRCICMKINRLFDGIWIMTRVMQSTHYPRQNTVGYLLLYQMRVWIRIDICSFSALDCAKVCGLKLHGFFWSTHLYNNPLHLKSYLLHPTVGNFVTFAIFCKKTPKIYLSNSSDVSIRKT